MGILPMRRRAILALHISLITRIDMLYTGKPVLSKSNGMPVPRLAQAHHIAIRKVTVECYFVTVNSTGEASTRTSGL